MKPLYIRGPVAWFGIDNHQFRVERDDGVRFLSGTVLPVPLLVEHNWGLEIGQVLDLQVGSESLVASCVIDESLFMSACRGVQKCGYRYKDLDIGSFIKVVLPSFSSYHKAGSFAIREISLVDVGRRKGGLWSVESNPEAGPRITRQRIAFPLTCLLFHLLYLVLCQRQQRNRRQHLCRDAKLCGLSTAFVSASSLSPLPSIKPSSSMTKSSDAVFWSDFKRLLKKHASDDSENEDSNDLLKGTIGNASKEPTYTRNEVMQLVLNLAKKQTEQDHNKRADRARLEKAMEKAIKRTAARDNVPTESPTGRHREKRQRSMLVETSSSDDDASEDGSGTHSYTSVPINRRIRKMMRSLDKGNPRKDKVKRRRQERNRNVEEGGSCSSDTDKGDTGDGGNKRPRQENVLSDKIAQQMNDGIKQIVSMLTPSPPTANESHEQAAQNDKRDTHGALDPSKSLDVKGSALLDNTQSTSVDQLFSTMD